MDDLTLLIGIFVCVLGLCYLPLLARRRRPAPLLQIPAGCVAVVLTPDQLSELAQALTERADHLTHMNSAKPCPYFRTRLEHLYSAADEIANARRRAG